MEIEQEMLNDIRALQIAAGALMYRYDLHDLEVQNYEMRLCHIRDALPEMYAALRAQQERENGCGCACGDPDPSFCETCKRIRVEAIKEKLERESSKPLTLEELKERMRLGEGIYVSNTDGRLMINQRKYMAAILDNVAAFGSYGEMHIQAIYGRGLTLAQDDYEITWLAYDHEPKEAR